MTGLERTPRAIKPLNVHLAPGKVRYVVFGPGGARCYGTNLTIGAFDIALLWNPTICNAWRQYSSPSTPDPARFLGG